MAALPSTILQCMSLHPSLFHSFHWDVIRGNSSNPSYTCMARRQNSHDKRKKAREKPRESGFKCSKTFDHFFLTWCGHLLGGGNSHVFFVFTPGEMIQFDYSNIVQMGGYNHHLVWGNVPWLHLWQVPKKQSSHGRRDRRQAEEPCHVKQGRTWYHMMISPNHCLLHIFSIRCPPYFKIFFLGEIQEDWPSKEWRSTFF